MEGSEGGAWMRTGLGREDGGERDGRHAPPSSLPSPSPSMRLPSRSAPSSLPRALPSLPGSETGGKEGRAARREVHCAWVWTGLDGW